MVTVTRQVMAVTLNMTYKKAVPYCDLGMVLPHQYSPNYCFHFHFKLKNKQGILDPPKPLPPNKEKYHSIKSNTRHLVNHSNLIYVILLKFWISAESHVQNTHLNTQQPVTWQYSESDRKYTTLRKKDMVAKGREGCYHSRQADLAIHCAGLTIVYLHFQRFRNCYCNFSVYFYKLRDAMYLGIISARRNFEWNGNYWPYPVMAIVSE